jgi:hypothetical protein
MAGILKIYSHVDSDQFLGHSWIEYCPIDGMPVTYGTWGNAPPGGRNGLLENLELGRDASACRVAFISNEQEVRLFELIARFRQRGQRAWTLHRPCSAFAAEAWHAATGERLAHRAGPVSTPALLAPSIVMMNGDNSFADGASATVGRGSSRRRKKRQQD